MAKVARNFLANAAGALWGSLVGVVAVPVYLKFVGVEGYGLIGFYTVLASLLTLMDAGFSAAAGRELARAEGAGSEARARVGDTVRILERGFLVAGALVGALVIAIAPVIATRWINVHDMGHSAATGTVRLMALVLIFQLPLGLYNGCLLGMQRHVVLNGINAAMSTMRVIGAVIALWLIAPSTEVFFAWQAVATLANVLVARNAVMGLLPARRGRIALAFGHVRELGGMAAGIGGINVLGLILTQLDKAVLSFLLPLEQFGYYMLAWTLSSLIYRLSAPLYNSVLPRMAELDARRERESAGSLFRRSAELMAVLVIPFSLFLAAYAQDIVWLWTGDRGVAHADRGVLALLAIGTMISATMYVPFAVHLAAGRIRPLLLVHALAAACMAPLVVLLATSAGIVGAAASWAVVNLGLCVGMVWITGAYMDRRDVVHWVWKALALPAMVAAGFLAAVKGIAGFEQSSRVQLFVELALVGAGCALATALATSFVRARLLHIPALLLERASRRR